MQDLSLGTSKNIIAALEIVRTDRGQSMMEDIRNVAQALQDEERRLLQQQSEQVETKFKNMAAIVVTGSILSFVFVAVTSYLLNQDIRDRQQAEVALKQARDDLETKVTERTAELAQVNQWLQRELFNRSLAEDALRESEERLQAILYNAPAVIYLKDTEGRYLLVNRQFETIFHITKEQFLGKNDYDFFPKETADACRANDCQILKIGTALEFEEAVPHDDGIHTYISIKFPLKNRAGVTYGVCGISTDITDYKTIETQIRASLAEKEVLLKEIHHRVKNNLQIISGLLYLQSRYVEDKQTLQVLQDNRERIQSMALLHEKLYGSENINKIDFPDYISNLTNNLFISYGVNTDFITSKLNIDPLSLDIDTAIPCGLIVNELISNSLKYAFPQGKSGTIEIEFKSVEKNGFELIVSDNGVGFLGELNFQNKKSLGMRLVHSLATKQLEGTLEVNGSQGTRFKIQFKI